jgi:hypothetical protein
MRTFILFTYLTVFLSIVITQVSYGQSNVLSGEYVHVPKSKSIFIERIHNGILFKSKPNGAWIFFEKQRNNLFFDKKGNRIEVVSHDEIIFIKRNSRRGLHYIKVVDIPDTSQLIPNENGASARPEGLWFDEKTDTYLIVVETRDGIKVRLKDSRLWYSYYLTNQPGTFVSDDGKSYVWNGLTLEYFHTENQFRLHFYKIADDFTGY